MLRRLTCIHMRGQNAQKLMLGVGLAAPGDESCRHGVVQPGVGGAGSGARRRARPVCGGVGVSTARGLRSRLCLQSCVGFCARRLIARCALQTEPPEYYQAKWPEQDPAARPERGHKAAPYGGAGSRWRFYHLRGCGAHRRAKKRLCCNAPAAACVMHKPQRTCNRCAAPGWDPPRCIRVVTGIR